MLRVDFGGNGVNGPWTTVNLDGNGNAHAAPDIVADVSSGEALRRHFAPGSIDEAQCIATLEHLNPWNIEDTLKLWRSLMKPGARLLIVVPDLAGIVEDYHAGKFGAETLAGMLYVPKDWQWRTPWEHHRWGWDQKSLTALLETAGFSNVCRVPDPEPGFVVDTCKVAGLAMEAFA